MKRRARRGLRGGARPPARPRYGPPGPLGRLGEGGRGSTHSIDVAAQEGEFRSERGPARHHSQFDVPTRHSFAAPTSPTGEGHFSALFAIVGGFQPVGSTGRAFASHKDASSLYTGRSCTPGRSSCLFLERALFCLRSNE